MPVRIPFLTLFALLIMTASNARAADPFAKGPHPVEATLIADVDAIVPGKSFSLGLHFKIKPHWHTYWIHPGDAGMPTSIKLTASGFKFGQIQWPTPHLFPVSGFKSFGYENEVMHLIRVHPPADLKPGDNVTLNAKAGWLACKEICLEGNAQFKLTLPVAKQSKPANESMFKTWKAKQPSDADMKPASDAITKIKQVTDADRKPRNVLQVMWKADVPPKDILWFPSTTQAISVDKIKMTHTKHATQITYNTEVFDKEEVADGVMQGVLVYVDRKGNRIGVFTSVRVALPKD